MPIASLFGCSSTYNYIFIVKNERSEGFCEVLAKSKSGVAFKVDVVAKGTATLDAFFDDPPNDLYVITWVDENKVKYSAEADLKKLLSRRFKGHIYFIIDEQNNLSYSASKEYFGEMMFEKTAKGIKHKDDSGPPEGGRTSGNA